MVRPGFLIVAMLLAVVGSRPATAQQLRGRLLELQSDAPIPVGVVTLLRTDGRPVAASLTDSLGNWRLVAPEAGSYLVAARRIGYQPWIAGPVEVRDAEDLRFLFHLRRAPVLLTPEYTTARTTQRQLELAGFYERQRADFGLFLTPDAISKRNAARISELLLGLPGVRLVATADGSAGGTHIQLRAGNLSAGGICRPRIIVDGVLFARGDARPRRVDDAIAQSLEQAVEDEMQRIEKGMSIDDIAPASAIAAIEVYRTSSQVPVQFGGASIETSCGVIVIWTRRGTPRGTG